MQIASGRVVKQQFLIVNSLIYNHFVYFANMISFAIGMVLKLWV